MALQIKRVLDGSIAQEIGLEPGDWIMAINREKIVDYIDYAYLVDGEFLSLTVKDASQTCTFEIEKEEQEDLGVEFVSDLGGQRGCANHCIFCFVDQLPKGMRESLYFKDDDWRLSFLMGNYVTLTNISEGEFQRILKRRVSPLYISVHTTDDELRRKMLGNPRAKPILPALKRLAEAEIHFCCQAVIVPGVNDGEVLCKTIEDLATLYPMAESLALVPVGLTGFREGLFPTQCFARENARDVVERVHQLQQRFLREYGTRFCFLSDEFYRRAELEVPPYEAYEAFDQIENGVGLLAKFEREVEEALEEKETAHPEQQRSISLATGVDAYPFMKKMGEIVGNKLGVEIHVWQVKNRFFGESITVAGLLTGRDLIEQLKDCPLGEALLLPEVMLKEQSDVFLDDVSVEQLSETLGVPVISVPVDGYEFVDAVENRNGHIRGIAR